MRQVELIRNYVRNRMVPTLRLWISTLPDTELEALQLLHGEAGARTADTIADDVLYALGHRKPSEAAPDAPRPRGRPPKSRQLETSEG